MGNIHETIEVYDRSAIELAAYFRSVSGSRQEDVNKAFELIGERASPNVLEIGCADGRDAQVILQRTDSYLGIDASRNLINLAQDNLPNANFLVADVREFDFPPNLDIIFAFASLVHLDREENVVVFQKAYDSLNEGGVMYLSMKKGAVYTPYIKSDEYGERQFYLYSREDIRQIAGPGFEIQDLSSGFVTGTDTEWFEIALKKL